MKMTWLGINLNVSIISLYTRKETSNTIMVETHNKHREKNIFIQDLSGKCNQMYFIPYGNDVCKQEETQFGNYVSFLRFPYFCF